jgi:steroid 5-alpha reductase family enzyme
VVIAAGAPQAWISLLGPLLMYIFLRFLTGIPHAERQSVRSRGEAYLAYQKTTSAFFPWKPRKS